MALHLGGMDSDAVPDKAGLKNLIQVMGVLSTEAAMAMLPRFDLQTQLFAAEKKSLREKVLKGVKPPSTAIELLKTPIFTPGLFPEEEFKRVDVRAREVDAQSYFPKLHSRSPHPASSSTSRGRKQASGFKRPLNPSPQDEGSRKRTRPQMPNYPRQTPKSQFAWRAVGPAGQGGAQGGQMSTPSSSGEQRGKATGTSGKHFQRKPVPSQPPKSTFPPAKGSGGVKRPFPPRKQ